MQVEPVNALVVDEALVQGMAHYEALYNEAPVGIGHASSDGQWIRVNRRLSEIVGYTAEELLQARFQDITAKEELAVAVAILHQMLNSDRDVHRAEHRFIHKNGSIVWVNLTVSVQKNAGGHPHGFIAVMEDITERRRTEERRQFLTHASASLLSSMDYKPVLQEVARMAIPSVADLCIIDVRRDDRPADPPVIEALTPQAEELLRNFRQEAGKETEEALLRVMQTRRPMLIQDFTPQNVDREIRNPAARATGKELGVRSLMVAPMESRGKNLGVVTLGRLDSNRRFTEDDLAMAVDLGHRIALAVDNSVLYQQAQEAISARDEFLSVASHELRTPLTPLLLYFQRLLSTRGNEPLEKLSPERLRMTLGRAHGQVRRLASLVESLLDVSRIKSGLLEIHAEDCDFTELSRELVSRFSETASRSHSSLILHADEGLHGHWDRIRIEQVLTNLIDNAIKYGRGRPITIEVHAHGDMASFRIQDQGIGIPPEKLDRVFDRFERAVPTRSFGGLGLGLYIARQIVEAHGGTIRVRSEVDVGSEFTVELPLSGAQIGPDARQRLPMPPDQEPSPATV